MKGIMKKLLPVFLAGFLAACSISPQQYEGEPLPLGEIAIIKTDNMRIQYINGESLGLGLPPKNYHLKPGYYELGVIFTDGSATSTNRLIIGIDLHAGKVYKLVGEFNGVLRWSYTFTEKDTGQPVGKLLETTHNWW